jgi:hypothetical protein
VSVGGALAELAAPRHPLILQMASSPPQSARAGEIAAERVDDTSPLPSPGLVAKAVLHLARLATSREGRGIICASIDDSIESYEPDTESIDTLIEVTEILLKDRARIRRRMADRLMQQVHQIVTTAFKDVQVDGGAKEDVEDVVEARLRTELGFSLTEAQQKQFAVNDAVIRERKGPSNAAAEALGKALGLETGRSIFESKKHAGTSAAVPGPSNRWVSLQEVQRFFEDVVLAAELERSRAPILPLDALRSEGQDEPLMSRLERSAQSEHRRALTILGDTGLAPYFLALLRGDRRASQQKLRPELQREWEPLRAQFGEFGLAIQTDARSTGSDAMLALETAAEQFSRDFLTRWRLAMGLD